MRKKNFTDYMREVGIGWTQMSVKNHFGGPDKIVPKKNGTTI
jgi:hypothetical protein